MEAKSLTNWFNWAEWKSVVDGVYSDDTYVNRKTLSRITAWEARDTNMPSVLICLKELLLAKLHQIDKRTASVEELQRYQYNLSINIVRFVNFITEPYQKALYAKAIKAIANEIGLPDWIVNMRHNATHYSLPSIPILEQARDYLLVWIKDKYIDTYKEFKLEKFMLDDVKNEIRYSFKDYMKVKYKKSKIKNKKMKRLQPKLNEKLTSLIGHFKNDALAIALEDGYMIPVKEQLQAMGIIAEEFMEQDSIEIPDQLTFTWTAFLDYCNKNDLIGMLFDKMINSYKMESCDDSTDSDLRHKFLLAWILYLLKFSLKNGEKYKFEFNYKDVLKNILQTKPSSLLLMFLKELGECSSFNAEISRKQLAKFEAVLSIICFDSFNIRSSFSDDSDIAKDSIASIYCYEPLRIEMNVNNEAVKLVNKKPNRGSVWQLVEEEDWIDVNSKLGLIDGQSYDNFNLDLPYSENQLNGEQENEQVVNGRKTNSNEAGKVSVDNWIENLKKIVMNNYWNISI